MFKKLMVSLLAVLLISGGISMAEAKSWDKVFKKSEKVDVKKVSFKNRFGIELVGDLYTPKTYKKGEKLPAIAVSGPFGAVKEQSSGLYAQTMAERGFITLAFDPSYTGESKGEPRYVASPDINTEDFQSAVDFLSVQDNVDPEKIGIIGICGWGGHALNTASIDTELNAQRIKDFKSGKYELAGGVVDPLPADAPQFVKDYYAYYKTPRGYHKRSLNSNTGWNKTSALSFINTPELTFTKEIRSAVLMIHGEKAHSCYFSKDAYIDMVQGEGSKYKDNKEIMIIPGASHVDLYDNADVIPFDKIEQFFKTYLK